MTRFLSVIVVLMALLGAEQPAGAGFFPQRSKYQRLESELHPPKKPSILQKAKSWVSRKEPKQPPLPVQTAERNPAHIEAAMQAKELSKEKSMLKKGIHKENAKIGLNVGAAVHHGVFASPLGVVSRAANVAESMVKKREIQGELQKVREKQNKLYAQHSKNLLKAIQKEEKAKLPPVKFKEKVKKIAVAPVKKIKKLAQETRQFFAKQPPQDLSHVSKMSLEQAEKRLNELEQAKKVNQAKLGFHIGKGAVEPINIAHAVVTLNPVGVGLAAHELGARVVYGIKRNRKRKILNREIEEIKKVHSGLSDKPVEKPEKYLPEKYLEDPTPSIKLNPPQSEGQ